MATKQGKQSSPVAKRKFPVTARFLPCSFPVTISVGSHFLPLFTSAANAFGSFGHAKFPAFFPVNGNFGARDGLAADCILRQKSLKFLFP